MNQYVAEELTKQAMLTSLSVPKITRTLLSRTSKSGAKVRLPKLSRSGTQVKIKPVLAGKGKLAKNLGTTSTPSMKIKTVPSPTRSGTLVR